MGVEEGPQEISNTFKMTLFITVSIMSSAKSDVPITEDATAVDDAFVNALDILLVIKPCTGCGIMRS
jgi:hypothetical protein